MEEGKIKIKCWTRLRTKKIRLMFLLRHKNCTPCPAARNVDQRKIVQFCHEYEMYTVHKSYTMHNSTVIERAIVFAMSANDDPIWLFHCLIRDSVFSICYDILQHIKNCFDWNCQQTDRWCVLWIYPFSPSLSYLHSYFLQRTDFPQTVNFLQLNYYCKTTTTTPHCFGNNLCRCFDVCGNRK